MTSSGGSAARAKPISTKAQAPALQKRAPITTLYIKTNPNIQDGPRYYLAGVESNAVIGFPEIYYRKHQRNLARTKPTYFNTKVEAMNAAFDDGFRDVKQTQPRPTFNRDTAPLNVELKDLPLEQALLRETDIVELEPGIPSSALVDTAPLNGTADRIKFLESITEYPVASFFLKHILLPVNDKRGEKIEFFYLSGDPADDQIPPAVQKGDEPISPELFTKGTYYAKGMSTQSKPYFLLPSKFETEEQALSAARKSGFRTFIGSLAQVLFLAATDQSGFYLTAGPSLPSDPGEFYRASYPCFYRQGMGTLVDGSEPFPATITYDPNDLIKIANEEGYHIIWTK